MNKTVLILLGVLVALAIAFYALKGNEQKAKTTMSPDRDLAVKSKASIDRIFIAEMNGATINLTKQQDGNWLINDTAKASITIMDQVLHALTKIRIDHIPPSTMNKTILDEMKRSAIKVEVYNKEDSRIKSLLIGRSTFDERNSFVVVEGYSQPYAVKVPGTSGTLRPLFQIGKVENWRSRDWLNLSPEQIKSVSVNYPREKSLGFHITRSADSFRIKPIAELVEIKDRPVKQRELLSYLEGFSDVALTGRADNYNKKDSIYRLVPHIEVSVLKTDGESIDMGLVPIYDDASDTRGGYGKYYVTERPNRLRVVQVRHVRQWLREYASFFREAD